MIYLYKALVKIGYLDIERAQRYLDEAAVCSDEFVDYVYQTLRDFSCTLEDIDIVSLAHQFIADCGHVPELNDYLFSNYLDTRFDLSPETAEKILGEVPIDERNEAWIWIEKETCG